MFPTSCTIRTLSNPRRLLAVELSGLFRVSSSVLCYLLNITRRTRLASICHIWSTCTQDVQKNIDTSFSELQALMASKKSALCDLSPAFIVLNVLYTFYSPIQQARLILKAACLYPSQTSQSLSSFYCMKTVKSYLKFLLSSSLFIAFSFLFRISTNRRGFIDSVNRSHEKSCSRSYTRYTCCNLVPLLLKSIARDVSHSLLSML